MAFPSEANIPQAVARSPRRRPSPRLDQYRRTWHFLRRNTLALFGLGVILLLVGIAVYAATTSVPWDQLTECYGTNNQLVTFQESNLPPGLGWSVALNTSNGNLTQNSTGEYINYSLPSGPAYNYFVRAPGGWEAIPGSGTVSVAESAQTIHIRFFEKPGAIPSALASGTVTPASGPLSCSICTYTAGTPSPGPNCYQTPNLQPSVIAPTVSFSPLASGPLPFGALTVTPDNTYFYNLYDGLLRGSDYSLVLSVTIVTVGALVGLILGAISGFWGGAVDEVIMRLVDIFLSIPQILFVIIVISVVDEDYPTLFGMSTLDTKVFLLIVSFMVVWWPFYARIVRGQVLVVREQKFVEAARASGASKGRIVMRHIIPNSMYPIFIQMSLDVGTVPLLTAFLVFLGFRIWPYVYFPEWGTIAALGTGNILENYLDLCSTGPCSIPWWQLFFPGVALFLFAISVNFLSDGLRDALDPRLRR
jgi:peptide/nickel transport system permease protein